MTGSPSARVAERTVAAIGRGAAWATVVVVGLTFVLVALRYGFSIGWIHMQELVLYLHAGVFTLAAAWALQCDQHVRVDIFYRAASPVTRARVDAAGTLLFLLPVCAFWIIAAWPYVADSWRLLEGSREAGGLPGVFLLKSLLLIMPALLAVQGIAGLVRRWPRWRPSGRNDT